MDPDGLVSRLPAALVGVVPGSTRATMPPTLLYVATSLGLFGFCSGSADLILGASWEEHG